MNYPKVVNEDKTLDALLSGASISRYGDGELRLALRRAERPAQPYSPELALKLRTGLLNSGDCLVGIPNLVSQTPKIGFWRAYSSPWVTNALTDRVYHSSFITRPDSAPWIDRPDYWDKVKSLWQGKEVTLVRGGDKSLTLSRMSSAKRVREVVGPRIDAWSSYDKLMKAIGTPDHPVILCLGITATVLAIDLCALGVQALDLGHIGTFMHRRGLV